MVRSPIAPTYDASRLATSRLATSRLATSRLATSRLERLTLSLRALYLGRPELISKLLAIVAFFSIGIVV